MKKSILFFLFVCLASVGIANTIVHGTVTDTTGAPVQGQYVTVADSTIWSISVATDSTGHYSVTVPPIAINGGNLDVYTTACNQVLLHSYADTIINIQSDFVLCSGTNVSGTIYTGLMPVGEPNAIVYLVQQVYDTMNTYILSAIDSTLTDSLGNYSIHNPIANNYPATQLLVKAALLPSAPNYNDYLPTYSYASLLWSGATLLTGSYNTVDIELVAGNNPGGPAFIGGDVQQGANKSTAVGDPLYKKILILTDMNNQAIAYTYSDAAGHFSFSNLAYGSYKLFGDAPGKQNPALTVTVDAAHPSVNNIEFEEHSHEFEGHYIATSVANVNAKLQGINVFPNPATDMIFISGIEHVNGIKTVTLNNVSGAQLYKNDFKNGEVISLQLAQIPNGVYILQVNTTEGNATIKVVK